MSKNRSFFMLTRKPKSVIFNDIAEDTVHKPCIKQLISTESRSPGIVSRNEKLSSAAESEEKRSDDKITTSRDIIGLESPVECDYVAAVRHSSITLIHDVRDHYDDDNEDSKPLSLLLADMATAEDHSSITDTHDVTDGCRPGLPPPNLVILDHGISKLGTVLLENSHSSGTCMKLCQRRGSFCVEPEKFHNNEASSFHFTAEVVHAIDEETASKLFYMFLISKTIDNKTYYLHAVNTSGSCDPDTLDLRLTEVPRETIINNNGIPESGQKFFFCFKKQPSSVLESLAYQGYYISFETGQIVVRKTLEKSDLQPNFYVDVNFLSNLSETSNHRHVLRKTMPCLYRLNS